MIGFVAPLDARHVDDNHWTLVSELTYGSEVLDGHVTVPAGFTTDFASVPRILPIVFACFGARCQPEAVVHDWLYRRGSDVTRAQADRVFLEAMESRGKPWRLRFPMYLGVRLFGWPK